MFTESAELIKASHALEDLMAKMVKRRDERARANMDEARGVYDATRVWMLALVLGGLAVSVLLGYVIARLLSRQLGSEPGYAVAIASRIAAGDFSTAVTVRSGDKSSLVHAMSEMQQELSGMVRDFKASAGSIASATRQIAAGNGDLSQRTEQQAASLEETASSMEELTGTVRQNADNARQASGLAANASGDGAQGRRGGGPGGRDDAGDQRGVEEDRRHHRGDRRDSVPDQHRSAERGGGSGARGEQGRGFAVVAGEVRSLAQRSANAAKEIKGLIGDTVARVDNGTTLVGQAGQTMEEIVQAVKRVTDIMGEISAASAEQSSGIEQVKGGGADGRGDAAERGAGGRPPPRVDRSKSRRAACGTRWRASVSPRPTCRPPRCARRRHQGSAGRPAAPRPARRRRGGPAGTPPPVRRPHVRPWPERHRTTATGALSDLKHQPSARPMRRPPVCPAAAVRYPFLRADMHTDVTLALPDEPSPG